MRRAKRAEEALEHARAEAAQASQRAASAEVKLQVLQKAVQQAEERAATLEMQVHPPAATHAGIGYASLSSTHPSTSHSAMIG